MLFANVKTAGLLLIKIWWALIFAFFFQKSSRIVYTLLEAAAYSNQATNVKRWLNIFFNERVLKLDPLRHHVKTAESAVEILRFKKRDEQVFCESQSAYDSKALQGEWRWMMVWFSQIGMRMRSRNCNFDCVTNWNPQQGTWNTVATASAELRLCQTLLESVWELSIRSPSTILNQYTRCSKQTYIQID